MQSEFIRSNCHDAPVVKVPVGIFSRDEKVVCTACGEVMGVLPPVFHFEKDALRFRYWWMLVGSFPTSRKISDFVRITGV